MLTDLLDHGLKLVICGTAAGVESAQVGHYYAGPGNKFWKTLDVLGLTPRQLAPAEYPLLLRYGIGLTDVVKGQAGNDLAIDFTSADPSALANKILEFRPRVLCFNGKKAAATFLSTKKVEYGRHDESIGDTLLFVAPSTSGAASGAWDISRWHELAALLNDPSARL